MRVKNLLEAKGNDVYTITPEETVFEALQKMAEKEIGTLVVVENSKMVGILSERDYARKIILKKRNSQETLVKDIMTTNVIHANPDQKVRQSLSLMTKNHFRHLPVLENDQLMGIISIEDVRRMG